MGQKEDHEKHACAGMDKGHPLQEHGIQDDGPEILIGFDQAGYQQGERCQPHDRIDYSLLGLKFPMGRFFAKPEHRF